MNCCLYIGDIQVSFCSHKASNKYKIYIYIYSTTYKLYKSHKQQKNILKKQTKKKVIIKNKKK